MEGVLVRSHRQPEEIHWSERGAGSLTEGPGVASALLCAPATQHLLTAASG